MDQLILRRLVDQEDICYQLDQIERCESHLSLNPDGQLELIFVTGNKNKVRELQQLLGELEWLNLVVLDINLPEIQAADVLDVVQEKCKAAHEHVRRMYQSQQTKPIVLIEDTSLMFDALNGMPGPYIKWFIKAIGVEGLPKLLSGFDNNNAQAECIFALMASDKEIVFSRGLVLGRIVEARGDSWGWDPVFEEKTSGKTYGEMQAGIKQQLSHRSRAVKVLREYLMTQWKLVH